MLVSAPVPSPLDRGLAVASFLAGGPVARARTGQTPHRVIFSQGCAQLRAFPPAPGRARSDAAPLFIVMPLINTWTIFDLLPGRSVVEKLVNDGIPVYLLDWGRPGPEAAEQPLSELVDGVLVRMLDRATRHARAAGTLGPTGRPDTLGYCLGGTFLAMALARHPDRARRMALLAAPIDMEKSGRLARWVRPELFPLDALVDGLGNVPGDLVDEGFARIRPQSRMRAHKALWDHIDEPDFRRLWAAVENWKRDTVPLPGAAYRSFVRACYFENRLMTGGWELDGRPVDLAQGRVPAVAFGASRDHICPTPAAFGLARVWGGPVRTAVVPGGHVGVCLGHRFPDALRAWLRAPLPPESRP